MYSISLMTIGLKYNIIKFSTNKTQIVWINKNHSLFFGEIGYNKK